jgi:hypothetical protein
LLDHVRPLSPNDYVSSSDSQNPLNPPNPGDTEYGIDGVDFEELGQRQLLRIAAVAARAC